MQGLQFFKDEAVDIEIKEQNYQNLSSGQRQIQSEDFGKEYAKEDESFDDI